MLQLLVLATESGIPPSNPWTKLAVPLMVLILVGSVYLLLRSNLGTRRGYLVMSVTLWGFAAVWSLFQTFGAPGTPQTVGPQNLPGQTLEAYIPVWVPFAATSSISEQPSYQVANDYPDGFGPVPEEFQAEADTGATEIQNVFASFPEGTPFDEPIDGTDEVTKTEYAEAGNGRPMIAATFAATCQPGNDGSLPESCEGLEVGEVDPAAEPVTLFAYFDAGSPLFPGLLMTGILATLFALHMVLLYRDEVRERREREELEEELAEPEQRPAPTPA